MPHKKDFWQGSRQSQLNKAKKWMDKFTSDSGVKNEEGKALKFWQLWKIPQELFAEFAEAYGRSLSALESVIMSGSRGGPLNVACREAFAALEKIARLLHSKYVNDTTLAPEELAELDIPERDAVRNPPQKPRYWPLLRMDNPRKGVVAFHLSAPPNADQDVSGFDRFVRMGILAPDGKVNQRSPNAHMYITEVPLLPTQLPEMWKANRRTEEKVFTELESGCKLFVSVAYMNSKGELGPWSPIEIIIIT